MPVPTQFTTSRRNAVDYHSFGLRRDYWHKGLRRHVFAPRPQGCSALVFHDEESATEPVGSAAFSELQYGGKGLAYKDQLLSNLSADIRRALKESGNGQTITLSLDLPGYAHLKRRFTVDYNTTLGDFGARVIRAFKKFYEEDQDNYHGPGVRFGAGQSSVCFDQLRLISVYLYQGYWHFEACYVYDG